MKNLDIPGDQMLRVNLFGVHKLPIVSARFNSIFTFMELTFNSITLYNMSNTFVIVGQDFF